MDGTVEMAKYLSLFLLLSDLDRSIAKYSLTATDTIGCHYKAFGAADKH
jgi:hypothetical protein